MGQADAWIRRTTTGCVALLALIAGTVSYLHMHRLVALHGQPGWVAALTPLSVLGMIVAASATLLADSRSGRTGGTLPWALLVAGSVASLGANVAVAEPTLVGRVIAAWPSFALTASFELLTRQVRRGAARKDAENQQLREPQPSHAMQGAGLRLGCGLSVRLGQVVVARAPTVSCGGRRGFYCWCRSCSSRWRTASRLRPASSRSSRKLLAKNVPPSTHRS